MQLPLPTTVSGVTRYFLNIGYFPYSIQVCGEWKRLGGNLTGDEMKVYVGIDMAKDKFDYCAMDDALNILCRGSNRENKNEIFKELSDLIRTLKSTSTMMKIGMESTG